MKSAISEEIEMLTRLLAYHYDIRGSIQALVAYQDRNYLITGKSGEKYILKVTMDENDLDFIRSQNVIFAALAKTTVGNLVPGVIHTSKGDQIVDLFMEGKTCYARLFNYLEGEFLAEAKPDIGFFADLGRTFALIDNEMNGSSAPAIKCRTHEWDLSKVLELTEDIQLIDNPADRRVVHYFLMKYREVVQPVYHKLNKGLIHGDGNDLNVLVVPKKKHLPAVEVLEEVPAPAFAGMKGDSRKYRVAGVIDFGDMVWGARADEVAIVLAYAMMSREDYRDIYREVIHGYTSIIPLTNQELSVIYYLTAARWCQTLVMAARKIHAHGGNDYHQVSVKGAKEMLHQWIRLNPLEMTHDDVDSPGTARGIEEIKNVTVISYVNNETDLRKVKEVQRRFSYFSRAVSLSYPEPIRMAGAAMQYMYSADGRTYLDCVNNIPHVGHCHPRVVEAGQRQMARLNTNTRYLYDSLDRYAERLLSKFPASLNKVFFVNSGSAATDLAVRLAEAQAGNRDYLVLDYAYHGNTKAAIGLSPYKFNRKGGKGQPENVTILDLSADHETPAGSRNTSGNIIPGNGGTQGPLSFFAESIVGCAGQIVLSKELMQRTVEEVRSGGGIYVADEVQTGFGRVGSKFWAYELYDVVPDMVILGKPMGNGHPMGAVVCTEEIARSFETGMEFFSSFGGNPVSCEIGLAVLDVIEEEGLQENARLVGDFLIGELKHIFSAEAQDKRFHVSEVRGSGLFLGIELVENESGKPATDEAVSIVNQMKESGFLLSTDGPANNVIKFKPPMCFSMENAVELAEAFRGFQNSIRVTS